jgi:hypothetical protein
MVDTATSEKPKERKSASDGFIPADAENITLFPQQVIDNLMHSMIALGAEMWTVRRRMYVLEKVLEKAGVSAEDVELYKPTDEEQAAWAEERNIFIKRTFGAMTRKGGGNDKQLDKSRM